MSTQKDLKLELMEEEEKEKKIVEEAREQTLANFIIISFIFMVAYKLMTGTF